MRKVYMTVTMNVIIRADDGVDVHGAVAKWLDNACAACARETAGDDFDIEEVGDINSRVTDSK